MKRSGWGMEGRGSCCCLNEPVGGLGDEDMNTVRIRLAETLSRRTGICSAELSESKNSLSSRGS